MIELAWEQSFEDHVEANRALHWDRLRGRLPFVAGLTLAAMALVGLVSFWIAPLVLLFILWIVAASRRRSSIAASLEPSRDSLAIGEVRWTLDESGIDLDLPGRHLRVGWGAFTRVRCTSTLLLLYFSAGRALFVPLRAVDDIDALQARIAAWSAAGGDVRHLPAPEGDPWVFEWEPSVDDHIAFVRGVLARQPTRVPLIVLGGLLALVGLLELPAMIVAPDDVVLFVAPMVLGLAGCALVLFGLGGQVTAHVAPVRVRLARWRDPESFPIRPMQLQLGPGGLYYKTPKGSGRVRWQAITSVDDADGCVNIMIGPLLGFSIPDRVAGSRADRHRLVADADRWRATATHKTGVSGERGMAQDPDNPFAPPGTTD